jgi:hypothetical protein
MGYILRQIPDEYKVYQTKPGSKNPNSGHKT